MKIPKTLGACADALYQLRGARLKLQKEVDALKADETALSAHIIDTLPKSQATGVAGKLARVSVVGKDVPQVQDWDAFYKYVTRTKQFDLLQRRLSDAAVMERLIANKKIPGVGLFRVTRVSLGKL